MVRLTIAVLISQALFHLLFTVGTVTVDTGSRNALHDHDLADPALRRTQDPTLGR